MYCVREVTDRLYWVGANDHRLTLFENIHPIPKGVSYNSYLLLDEKTVLFDTIDWSCCRQLVENVEHLLGDRALDGKLFADEVNFERDWLDEARRYYTNIVGKYVMQVQSVLKKAAGLDIALVCPLHGPVWRKDFGSFLEKYLLWSSYAPEEKSVMLAYASVYGHTENAANILAVKLCERGVRVRMYDTSDTPASYILSDAFRCSHLVFAATTYNNGVFVTMENLLHDIANHNLQGRKVAIVENGSWAPASGKLMREMLSGLKNTQFIGENVTLRSSLAEDQLSQLDALADAIAADINA